jgi:hypothetical protein
MGALSSASRFYTSTLEIDMSRGISLLLQTKTRLIDSGFRLSGDAHVDLAYRVVEAGIYGTLGRKAWNFAIVEGTEVVAMFPMYRKVEKNELVRYVPRIAPQNIRGAFVGLSMALEAIADDHPVAVEYETHTGQAVGSTEAIEVLERIVHADAQEASASQALSQPQGAESNSDSSDAGRTDGPDDQGNPKPEVHTLPDGSQIEVVEWEPVTAEEFVRMLGTNEQEAFGGPLVRVDDTMAPSNGNA